MISYQELKIRLASSAFRSRFKLDTAGRRYALEKGPSADECFTAFLTCKRDAQKGQCDE